MEMKEGVKKRSKRVCGKHTGSSSTVTNLNTENVLTKSKPEVP